MTGNKTVLGLVGSPNSGGLTNQLVTAALESAARAGAATELVQMSNHVVNACRDCLPWVCKTNLKCTYEDENFEVLSNKIINCGGLVLGTPVYLWDTSAMVKYLILKMFRVFGLSGQLEGLPALGIAIAGGTGNGLISGLRPVYHFFQFMQMRALEPVPVTRFNLDQATKRAKELGQDIAGMIQERNPFSSRDESLFWYDRLPYLGESRAAERRLLAALTFEAIPEGRRLDIEGALAQADILAASGQPLDAMIEICKVIDSCSKIFNEK
jgi:multimeric flavodoxin WrbA